MSDQFNKNYSSWKCTNSCPRDKNAIENINSRGNQCEKRVSELKNMADIDIIHSEVF